MFVKKDIQAWLLVNWQKTTNQPEAVFENLF